MITLDNISETALSNRLLLLWLLYDAMKLKPLGDTKAHKLAYLSELDMVNQQESGFSYEFKKLPLGPYSDDLQEDIGWLEEQQLISSTPYGDGGKLFHDERFGKKLLADFKDMFIRNNEFTRKIFAVNVKYAKYNTNDLVDIVHKMPQPFMKNLTIDDAEIGETLLYPLPSNKAKIVFNITPEELDTLEVYLDYENYLSTVEATESAKTKPMLRLDEVF